MFYDKTSAGYILRFRVTPNASRMMVGNIFTDAQGVDFLKISITAVPEKGKANQELIKYLSKILDIGKTNFSIISGETDHYKKILLSCHQTNQIEEKLNLMEKSHDSSNH